MPPQTRRSKPVSNLVQDRPKRICRLPSKFDDHSISPTKFIPVGFHASTPLLPSKKPNANVKKATTKKTPSKTHRITKISKTTNKPSSLKKLSPAASSSADSNNNPKRKTLRNKKESDRSEIARNEEQLTNNVTRKKLLKKDFSFKVLEEKKKSSKRDSSHLDVYEFTYDPTEEPPPQKKKVRKVVKKPSKPKTVVFKANYNSNMTEKLNSLKNIISKKPIEPLASSKPNTIGPESKSNNIGPKVTDSTIDQNPRKERVRQTTDKQRTSSKTTLYNLHGGNMYTRVEDIAADFEPMMDHDNIDYSPVTSPIHSKSPQYPVAKSSPANDPLNLREESSFFDEAPIACSSMNMSVRHPDASPWRVQFEQLPLKWNVNMNVKANMTPAVESSFINYDDNKNKKKHVYTNIVPETNEALPDIFDNTGPNLKQTSIISFIKEVVERSASKKKQGKSLTPVKANSVFDDISNISINADVKTPVKSTNKDVIQSINNSEKVLRNTPNAKNKENENIIHNEKQKGQDKTFFGFDESEDQENVSPIKLNPRVKALRPRARAVLQEINAKSGPTRAKMPVAAKNNMATSSEVVNKIYEQMKTAENASVFPEKIPETNNVVDTNAADLDEILNDDDSQSVHLFEDMEVVHHVKPSRKSYGKSKKVAFQSTTLYGYENNAAEHDSDMSDNDDLADLTFDVQHMEQKSRPKKKAKKNQLSKKEKAEMEAWAAQFNSMCEDIEEFPLVVE